jgi:hypothetical protein
MQDKQFYRHFKRSTAALFCVLILFSVPSVHAQTLVSKAEVGGQISVIDLRDSIQEKPPGVGGRFTYNLTDYLSFDSELNYFSTAEVDLNRTQGLFGVKVGRRFGGPSIGLFTKARPGFMHFHGERTPGVSINGTTKFALDLGGVLEVYPARRLIVRFDVGDTLIFYNNETIRRLSLPGGPQQRLNTSHSLQASLGIGFHF